MSVLNTYDCIECGAESSCKSNKMNKFCSNVCSAANRKKETLSNFYKGNISYRQTLKKLLVLTVGNFCFKCKNDSTWLDEELVLQLDHIDGNASNNMPNNLQLLCPNCHSQTKTFGFKNKGFGRKTRGLKLW